MQDVLNEVYRLEGKNESDQRALLPEMTIAVSDEHIAHHFPSDFFRQEELHVVKTQNGGKMVFAKIKVADAVARLATVDKVDLHNLVEGFLQEIRQSEMIFINEGRSALFHARYLDRFEPIAEALNQIPGFAEDSSLVDMRAKIVAAKEY